MHQALALTLFASAGAIACGSAPSTDEGRVGSTQEALPCTEGCIGGSPDPNPYCGDQLYNRNKTCTDYCGSGTTQYDQSCYPTAVYLPVNLSGLTCIYPYEWVSCWYGNKQCSSYYYWVGC